MKNLFITIALSLILSVPALAINVEVEALSDFSTNNPPKYYSVKIVEPVETKKGGLIERGSIVEGKISVTEAKRIKKDATFTFTPTTLTTPDGNVFKAKKDHIGKYKKEIDKGNITKNLALTAGNFALKGFSTGYTAIEGLIKNEQGNRLKSSAIAIYEKTPVSYVQKGDALEIKKGEHFFIKFKIDNEDDDNNDDNNNYEDDVDNYTNGTD